MDTVEARITEIVWSILERPHADLLANLAEAGTGSLRAWRSSPALNFIEREYGVDLVDTYFAAPMIARLAEEVRRTQDRCPARLEGHRNVDPRQET